MVNAIAGVIGKVCNYLAEIWAAREETAAMLKHWSDYQKATITLSVVTVLLTIAKLVADLF